LSLLLLCLAWNIYEIPSYSLLRPNPDFSSAAFELTRLVPPDASLATDKKFTPIAGNRHRICKVQMHAPDLCDWRVEGVDESYSIGKEIVGPDWKPEYVLLGADSMNDSTRDIREREWLVQDLTGLGGEYRLLSEKSGVYLLHLRTKAGTAAAAFTDSADGSGIHPSQSDPT
jgi:hypothetical protein